MKRIASLCNLCFALISLSYSTSAFTSSTKARLGRTNSIDISFTLDESSADSSDDTTLGPINSSSNRRSLIASSAAAIAASVFVPLPSYASGTDGKYIVLNSGGTLQDDVSTDVDLQPMAAIERIDKLWSQLESKYTKDGLLDYVAVDTDPAFPKLQAEVSHLQNVSLDNTDTPTKMAFVINLYNFLIKYAFVSVGIPKSDLVRYSFFDTVAVNIGGEIFSFNDLENGILRANSRPPYHLNKPFGKGDARGRLALSKVNPRIHFALNCGAKSCPPVRRYTAGRLEEELEKSACDFCQNDENVLTDESKGEIYVSKIFKWYSGDFGDVPATILQFLEGEKRERLNNMIQRGRINVQFLDYNWTTNESNSKTFG